MADRERHRGLQPSDFLLNLLLYTYKFLRDVIFVDDQNPGFLRFIFEDHLSSTLKLHIMHCDCFKNFKDSVFVDYKLPAKKAKIKSLKNLYA